MKFLFVVLASALAFSGAAMAGTESGNSLKPFGTGDVSVDGGIVTLTNGAGEFSGVYMPSWAQGFTPELTRIGAMSFDVKGTVNASSPRISLPLDTDGDGDTDGWAYLSAFYCTGSGAATTEWFTADFTSSSCLIYTSFGGAPYAGLDALAAADPDAQVAADNYVFVILDDPGTVQISNVQIKRGPAH
jgi:hypothetical protein